MASLRRIIADLEAAGDLRRIDHEFDPRLEIAHIQRRAFAAKAPALLFTRVKGCAFPMLANLYGTRERLRFIFRRGLPRTRALLQGKTDPLSLLRKPAAAASALRGACSMPPKKCASAPVLECEAAIADLPKLVSWPADGGPFITLPLVLSEDPDKPGALNLGMYRVQLGGNDYAPDEVGMHYQLMRGIGVHHARALARGGELPVRIHVGGPPALAVAAVMPLPEGLNELLFAGLLGGERIRVFHEKCSAPPIIADADFCISGRIVRGPKPEGPFGDHLGYYSLRHDFPVMKVDSVRHRKDAVWPFTSVGRPPQEDTVFGDFIHELTGPLVPAVFNGVKEVHAVDCAGVHPLLLAIGSERYTAWEAARKPRELITQAMHLLGTTQTALAKFLLMVAAEDAPGLSCRDIPAFLRHLLEITDFSRDLHFLTRAACDTLDYSGNALHEGSKLIWAAAGEKKRSLASEISGLADLPPGFGNPRLAAPGIFVIEGPAHKMPRGEQDEAINELCARLGRLPGLPLLAVVDDAAFCAQNLENFLWTTFTRADPAQDSYGANAAIQAKHWACSPPFALDARAKAWQPDPLTDDPAIVRKIENLAGRGGPLEGLIG